MIIERFPEVRALSDEEKLLLAEELREEVGEDEYEPTPEQEAAIAEVLDARWEEYLREPSKASSWEDVKRRLQDFRVKQ